MAMQKQTLLSKVNTHALVFSLIVIIFLGIMRFLALFWFGNSEDIHNNLHVLGKLFTVGLRFDLRVVGISLLLLAYLPYVFFFWIKKQSLFLKWLRFSLALVLIYIVLLAFIDIGYLLFFGTPIDILIFGLFEDDTQAVIESGFAYPSLILLGIIAPLLAFLLVFLFLRFAKKTLNLLPAKNWSLILLLPLIMLAARGSAGTFPLTLKQSSISSNSFINSLTQNAVFHMKYAIANREENNLNKSTQKILSQARVKNYAELKQKAGFSRDYPLIRKTAIKAEIKNSPPHVIFVQMEGWSTHIALTDAADNPVLGSFRKHARQDYFLPNFFCNQNGTNPTIENILLNSPLTPLSQSSGYKTSFSMSNIRPFKEKGYHAIFLSGGFSSWRNHDIFWPRQGFDEYIGRTVIEDKFQVQAKDNPWGAYDEYVFKYLEYELQQQQKPAFFYVLTTNNHPPVRLPADYHPPDFKIQNAGSEDELQRKKLMLAGYHYQTNAFGDFLEWLKNSPLKDQVIVVATGDHPLRGFDDYTSSEKQFLHFAVPAYFYLPEKYDLFKTRPKSLIQSLYGSHADLFPTLFELALNDASYYAFGQTVMQKTMEHAYGWNYKNAFLFKDGVVDSNTNQLYLWNRQNKMLLDPHGKQPTKQQKEVIEKEKYRRWLKEYLLYKDKEATSK